jgi:hypothetical protein
MIENLTAGYLETLIRSAADLWNSTCGADPYDVLLRRRPLRRPVRRPEASPRPVRAAAPPRRWRVAPGFRVPAAAPRRRARPACFEGTSSMKISTAQDLHYRTVISRGEHETWPPLVIGQARCDVTEVTVEVTVDDGEFRARPAYVQRGRRIRADGSLGHPIGGSRVLHTYSGPRGGPAWDQAEMFAQAALQAARARPHRRLGRPHHALLA